MSLKLNVMTLTVESVTADADEVNVLDGMTASTAELNKLDGATVTTAEINRLDADTPGIDGANIATLANASVLGVPPVQINVDIADASGDTDIVLTRKMRVMDAWAVNTGIAAHASADTWQLKNGSSAISDAVAKTATVNAVKRVGTLNPANATINAGGTLRITAAKNTNAAVTLSILLVPVASTARNQA